MANDIQRFSTKRRFMLLLIVIIFLTSCANIGDYKTIYEVEFYANLLQNAKFDKNIYISDLVPVEWDTMYVFPIYASSESKIKYAGYEYAKNITTDYYEVVISLLFKKGKDVVYYVDSIVPWKFTVFKRVDGKVTIKCGKYEAVRDDVFWQIADAKYWYPEKNVEGKELLYSEKPYIRITIDEEDHIMITIGKQ